MGLVDLPVLPRPLTGNDQRPSLTGTCCEVSLTEAVAPNSVAIGVQPVWVAIAVVNRDPVANVGAVQVRRRRRQAVIRVGSVAILLRDRCRSLPADLSVHRFAGNTVAMRWSTPPRSRKGTCHDRRSWAAARCRTGPAPSTSTGTAPSPASAWSASTSGPSCPRRRRAPIGWSCGSARPAGLRGKCSSSPRSICGKPRSSRPRKRRSSART
jgi:hypothetical protein